MRLCCLLQEPLLGQRFTAEIAGGSAAWTERLPSLGTPLARQWLDRASPHRSHRGGRSTRGGVIHRALRVAGRVAWSLAWLVGSEKRGCRQSEFSPPKATFHRHPARGNVIPYATNAP